MSSATNQVARTQGSSWANTLWAQGPTVYKPQPPLVTSPFLTEHSLVQPISGSAIPGGTAVWELPYDVDLIKSISLDTVVDRRAAALGGGTTHARLIDWFGLLQIEELTVQFGTDRLQRVRPMEMFIKAHSFFIDDDKKMLQQLASGGLGATEREARLLARQQRFTMPLICLLGAHLRSDPGQALGVRMLAERIRITIQFAQAKNLCEIDAGAGFSFDTAGGAAANPPAASAWFLSCGLLVEGKHLFDSERVVLEKIYKQPRRYFLREYQPSNSITVAGTHVPGDVITANLREFSQPMVAMYFVIRAAKDLARDCTTGTGSFGRNLINFSPWIQPFTGAPPIFSQFEITVGSNAWLLKATPVDHLLAYEEMRSFKGVPWEFTNPAIPKIAFSHSPTVENAQLGYVDPSQMDNIQLKVTVNPLLSTAAHVAAANINAVMTATSTIGENSDVQIDVIADTFSELNFGRAMIARGIN